MGSPQRASLPGATAGDDAPVRSLIGVAVNPEVDAYIRRSVKWPEVMTDLRPSLLSCGLTEEIKWASPATAMRARTSSSSRR